MKKRNGKSAEITLVTWRRQSKNVRLVYNLPEITWTIYNTIMTLPMKNVMKLNRKSVKPLKIFEITKER